jgi:hypothetical protein
VAQEAAESGPGYGPGHLQTVLLSGLNAIGKGETVSVADPSGARRCWSAEYATAEAPRVLCWLSVKQTTNSLGICTVHTPDLSLTPVRLSIKT